MKAIKISNDAVLENQLILLREILDTILTKQSGESILNKVEDLRSRAENLRANYTEEGYAAFKLTISSLQPPDRQQVIRAFSIYLHLVNIAEHNRRIRVRKMKQDELEKVAHTIENAVQTLKEKQISEDAIQKIINELSLELVITAHPTEASRRTVLEIKKRIAMLLMKLDYPMLSMKEKEKLEESLYNEITALWQTDELRHIKPIVMDEVRHGLRYFDETLFDVLPDIHQDLETHLSKTYENFKWEVPNFLRFGSWIGGDRDGNPFVTSEITWETLHIQRDLILKKYQEVLIELMKRFSHSTNRTTVSLNFIEDVEKEEKIFLTEEKIWPVETDVYRRKFAIILERLRNIGVSELGYKLPDELLIDLNKVKESATKHISDHHELKGLRKLTRQIDLFGFHLVKLDIRNHSGEHEAAISELFQKVNITPKYQDLDENEKISVLQKVLQDPRPTMLMHQKYSKETVEMLNTFQTIKKIHDEFGCRAIDVYLISKAQSESDVLEVLVLAKEAGIYRIDRNGKVESDINVAPLLETIDDLVAGPKIMKNLFEMEVYQNHLKERNFNQEIMIGYSDGSKDGGTISAHWKLYKAQQEIYNIAKPFNVNLKFFHGRGGSLGRGGGPLNRSILSQPAEMLGKGVKITEQGEVLSSRYLLADIAYFNLERAVSTLLTASVKTKNDKEQKAKWEKAMEEISELALEKYQSLVFKNEDFFHYFKQVTPLPELSALNIGSRPMSRKNSEQFDDLRAIPWVFAWSQCRQFFPEWYAAGTGLATFAAKSEGNLKFLQSMYKEWDFFRVIVQNLKIATTKTDIETAAEYNKLVKDDKEIAERIFRNIKDEYYLTKEIAMKIAGETMSEDTLTVNNWIERRNTYLFSLNFIQVDLIKQMRSTKKHDDNLLTDVLLTISGIAAGIRNTG